jgi:hypothetical protein
MYEVYYNDRSKTEVRAEEMDAMLARIQGQASAKDFRVTQHAQVEMDAEEITLDEVLSAIASGQILENYAEHKRGACCLLYGRTHRGRPLHVVCTSAQPLLIIITVYEPLPPKWVSPTQRRRI